MVDSRQGKIYRYFNFFQVRRESKNNVYHPTFLVCVLGIRYLRCIYGRRSACFSFRRNDGCFRNDGRRQQVNIAEG
jgi:hypothetical protein